MANEVTSRPERLQEFGFSRIHAAGSSSMGTARVGNSPDGYFHRSRRRRAIRIWSTLLRVALADAEGRIKRQAARFRITPT